MSRKPIQTINTCLIATFIGRRSAVAKVLARRQKVIGSRPETGRQRESRRRIAATRVRALRSRGSRSDIGGEGGIRTHGTVARTPHFECGAFDHSATSPRGTLPAGRPPVETGALAAPPMLA